MVIKPGSVYFPKITDASMRLRTAAELVDTKSPVAGNNLTFIVEQQQRDQSRGGESCVLNKCDVRGVTGGIL